jgi:O-methyltransferase involved in polyketide biosynthesis
MDDALDVAELTYNDPDRADVADWLAEHGWASKAVSSQDEMRRLGRAVVLEQTDDKAFSVFVTAEKR